MNQYQSQMKDQTYYAVCDLGGRIFRLDFALVLPDFPTSSALTGGGSAGSLILRLDCNNIPLSSRIRSGEKAGGYVTTYSGFTATRFESTAAGSLAAVLALSSTSAWVQTGLRDSDKVNGDSDVSFAGSWDGSGDIISSSKPPLGIGALGGLSGAGNRGVSTGISNVSGVDWNEGMLDGGEGKAGGKATNSGGSGEILYSPSASLPRPSAFEGVSEPSATSISNTNMLQFGATRHEDVHLSFLSICSDLLTPAFRLQMGPDSESSSLNISLPFSLRFVRIQPG